jgi:DNA polymerase-3 subunit gamma/tau
MVARLVEGGQDLRVFARSMLDHLRALLITKQVDEPGDLIDATEEARARYAGQADAFGAARLLHLLRLVTDALADMREQTSPRLALELAVVRATLPEVDDTAAAALHRVERLERLLEVGGVQATPAAAPARGDAEPDPKAQEAAKAEPDPKAGPKKTAARASAKAEPAVAKDDPPPAPRAAAGLVDLDKVRRSWPMVLEEVRKKSRSLHALLADATVGAYEQDAITLEARYEFHAKQLAETKNARVIALAMREVLGVNPQVRAVVRAPEPEDAPDESASQVSGDPLDIVKAGFGDDVIEE